MKISEDLLLNDLAVLGHGGQEAISLFLEMAKRFHETGSHEALRDWIAIATPALPEKERAEVIMMLMAGFLRLNEIAQRASPTAYPSPGTFH